MSERCEIVNFQLIILYCMKAPNGMTWEKMMKPKDLKTKVSEKYNKWKEDTKDRRKRTLYMIIK